MKKLVGLIILAVMAATILGGCGKEEVKETEVDVIVEKTIEDANELIEDTDELPAYTELFEILEDITGEDIESIDDITEGDGGLWVKDTFVSEEYFDEYLYNSLENGF